MPTDPISTAATTMAGTGAVGLGAAIGVSMIDSASMSMFGVPAIVPFFAFWGAAAALVYSEPIKPWYRMALILMMNVMLGIVGALSLPHLPAFGWTADVPKQLSAFFIAGLSLWVMPVVASRAGPMLGAAVERLLGNASKPGGRG